MRDKKAETKIDTIAIRITRFQRTIRRREQEQKDENRIEQIKMTLTTAGGQIRRPYIIPTISSSVLYIGTTELSILGQTKSYELCDVIKR